MSWTAKNWVIACFIGAVLLPAAVFAGLGDAFAGIFIFYPRRYTQNLTSDTCSEVQFKNSKGQVLTGCYFPYAKISSEKPAATILYAHGNGENIAMLVDFANQVRSQLRCSVFIFDYAGYGKSEGTPTTAGILNDGNAALDYLTKHEKIPVDKIIVWGFSLGGSIAVDLASKHQTKGCIVQSSFTSLPNMGEKILPFIPAKLLLYEQLNSEKKMRAIRCPVFISHGKKDNVIPYQHGVALFEAANQPKEFYELPDGFDGHNSPLCEEHWKKIVRFVKSVR